VVFFAASRTRRFLRRRAAILAGQARAGIHFLEHDGAACWSVPVLNSAPNYCKLEEAIDYAIRPRGHEFLTLLMVWEEWLIVVDSVDGEEVTRTTRCRGVTTVVI
jgi:hypothetical protein